MIKNIISRDEYFRITNCFGNIRLPEFTVEQVQEFLVKRGYEIIVHTAPVLMTEVASEFGSGEVRPTGRKFIQNKEVILAIHPGAKLPDSADSIECQEMNFLSVFKKEMLNKLMNI